MKLLSRLLLTVFAGSMIFTGDAVAQVNVFEDVCRKAPNATACKESRKTGNQNPIFGPNGFLTKVINIISLLVGIASVIMIIIGGLRYITSGANPQDVSNARETVLYAIIGLLVAVSAQFLVRFILFRIG